MNPGRIKLILALVILPVSIGWLYLTFNPIPPKQDVRPHEALGVAMAKETAGVAGPGAKIFVIAPDPATFKSGPAAAQMKSFYKELSAAKLSVAGTNLVKLNPLALVRMPPSVFFPMARKLAEKDVIVSFVGAPILNPEQARTLPQQRPRVVAACTGDAPRQSPLKRLFETQLLHVAIISNPEAPNRAPETGDVFGRYYKVITSKNADELPAPDEGVTLGF